MTPFDLDVVQLSRLQFGLTAMYHFLFVPLTLGLALLLGIMESVYVMTGREIWRQMTKFWGLLFGINFAMGVATGITMEFQFGMNWAYYSHYVGDVFGAPLAIEGLMAFFLEATFIGLFFFGWNRLSKVAHLGVTWMVALGSNLSALWILVANGWMQHPVGAALQPRHHAHGGHRLHGGDLEPGRPGEVRPHRQRRLRHRRGLRARDQRLLSAARPARRDRQALDDGRRELRPCRRPLGRRPRRRERLHRRREPEDEDRRHRGDVGDRAGAGVLHGLRPAQHGNPHHRLRRSRCRGCWA